MPGSHQVKKRPEGETYKKGRKRIDKLEIEAAEKANRAPENKSRNWGGRAKKHLKEKKRQGLNAPPTTGKKGVAYRTTKLTEKKTCDCSSRAGSDARRPDHTFYHWKTPPDAGDYTKRLAKDRRFWGKSTRY